MGETSAEHEKTEAPWWAWVLLVVVTGYVTIKAHGWVADVGTRDASAAWTIAAVTCVPVVALVSFKSRRENDLWMPRRLVPIVFVLVFGVVVGAYNGGDEYEHGFVAAYCKYGSVSQVQLDECRSHVQEGDIENSDTNAARFARTDLEECLEDSGPFCPEILDYRLVP